MRIGDHVVRPTAGTDGSWVYKMVSGMYLLNFGAGWLWVDARKFDRKIEEGDYTIDYRGGVLRNGTFVGARFVGPR